MEPYDCMNTKGLLSEESRAILSKATPFIQTRRESLSVWAACCFLNGGSDPDAVAYTAALAVEGVTPSDEQATLINNFISGEKSAGRWDKIGRLFFPIWADQTGNLICMKTLAMGHTDGIVDQSMGGHIQGDGFTGYFDIGATPTQMGMTPSDFHACVLISKAQNAAGNGKFYTGVLNGAPQYIVIGSNTGFFWRFVAFGRDYTTSAPRVDHNGIIILTRDAGDDVSFRRNSAGFETLNRVTSAATGAESTINMYACAMNSSGTASNFSDAELGAMCYGRAFDEVDSMELSANLKTLWEGCTGRTLP